MKVCMLESATDFIIVINLIECKMLLLLYMGGIVNHHRVLLWQMKIKRVVWQDDYYMYKCCKRVVTVNGEKKRKKIQ